MRLSRPMALLLSLLLLTGCWDQRELEEGNYIIAVAIDKGQKERLAVTFILAGPNQVSAKGGEGDKKGKEDQKGSDEGGDKGGGSVTVEAPTLLSANFYLNTVIPRPTSLAQTKLIMLSEELVRSEGMVIMDEAARNRDLRRSAMLVVTKQPIKEVLKELPPGPEGLGDFAFIQTSSEARRSGFLPVGTTLNDFLVRASTAYQEPVAYYAALTKQKSKGETGEGDGEKEEGKQESEQGQQGAEKSKDVAQKRLIPGQSQRKGGPALDFFGTAAFRETKLVGILDAQETRALLIVQNSFTQSNLDLFDAEAKQVATVRLSSGRPTRIKAKLVDGRPEFEIRITLEGEVLGMPLTADYTQTEQRDRLEAQVAMEIKRQVEAFFKKSQEWQADVGGLGRFIVRKFPTVDAWHQFDWPSKYKDAKIAIDVRMELRRFGVQLNPQPTGGDGR